MPSRNPNQPGNYGYNYNDETDSFNSYLPEEEENSSLASTEIDETQNDDDENDYLTSPLIRQNAFIVVPPPSLNIETAQETHFTESMTQYINNGNSSEIIELFHATGELISLQLIEYFINIASMYFLVNDQIENLIALTEIHDNISNPLPPVPQPQKNDIDIQQAIKDNIITSDDIPDECICAISGQVMTEAVHITRIPNAVFEKSQIEHWIQIKHTHPHDRSELKTEDLVVATDAQKAINDFINELTKKIKKNTKKTERQDERTTQSPSDSEYEERITQRRNKRSRTEKKRR